MLPTWRARNRQNAPWKKTVYKYYKYIYIHSLNWCTTSSTTATTWLEGGKRKKGKKEKRIERQVELNNHLNNTYTRARIWTREKYSFFLEKKENNSSENDIIISGEEIYMYRRTSSARCGCRSFVYIGSRPSRNTRCGKK